MSQAQISLFAEIQLKKDRLLADAKALPNELRQAMGGKGFELPVSFGLAADTQARLTAALKKIVPPSIDVRINWIPGNMPGGVPSSGGGQPLAAPGAAQVGGGGAGSNLYNPFSPRGLARLVGSGLAVYGATTAIRTATGIIEGRDTQSRPDRILEEMFKPGSQHFAGDDKFLRGQAGQTAALRGEKEIFSTIESIPLVGTLAKFVDAIVGTTRAIEDEERAVHRLTDMHEYAQREEDAGKLRDAAGTHDPLVVLAEQQRQEREKDQTAIKTAAYERDQQVGAIAKLGPKADLTNLRAAQENLDKVTDIADANEERQKREADQARQAINVRRALSVGDVRSTEASTMGSDLTMRGDAAGAMRARQLSEALNQEAKSQARINDPKISSGEKERREMEGRADAIALYAKQGLERARFEKEQERAAGDSAARIAEVTAAASERMLRATGNTYDVMIAESKRQTAERVDDLLRQANAEIGNTEKKKQLLKEAAAAEAAGRVDLESKRVARQRNADLESRQSASDLGVATLRAGGQHSAADRKAQDDRYNEESAKIIESGDNVPQRIRSLDDRYKAQRMGMDRDKALESEQRQLRTLRSNAEFTGDNATGSIEELRTRTRHNLEEAGGNLKEHDEVIAEAKADLRNLRRSLSPRVRRSANGEQFSHDLGNAIGEGPFNADAKKLFDKTEQELKAGGVSNYLPAASAKMEKAAEKLEKAADKLGGRTLAVLDT